MLFTVTSVDIPPIFATSQNHSAGTEQNTTETADRQNNKAIPVQHRCSLPKGHSWFFSVRNTRSAAPKHRRTFCKRRFFISTLGGEQNRRHENTVKYTSQPDAQQSTTSFLTAAAMVYAAGAGITAAAGTRLALQSILIDVFVCIIHSRQQLPRLGLPYQYISSLPLQKLCHWAICAPAASLSSGSRFSGSLSGIEPLFSVTRVRHGGPMGTPSVADRPEALVATHLWRRRDKTGSKAQTIAEVHPYQNHRRRLSTKPKNVLQHSGYGVLDQRSSTEAEGAAKREQGTQSSFRTLTTVDNHSATSSTY